MLIVEETPVTSEQRIYNRDTTIERQLRNLRSRQFAVCITPLRHRLELIDGVRSREETVVSGLLDRVLDRLRVRKVDGHGEDLRLRLVGGVCSDNVLANFSLVALLILDSGFVAKGHHLRRVRNDKLLCRNTQCDAPWCTR